jgi:hypothetical protein
MQRLVLAVVCVAQLSLWVAVVDSFFVDGKLDEQALIPPSKVLMRSALVGLAAVFGAVGHAIEQSPLD